MFLSKQKNKKEISDQDNSIGRSLALTVLLMLFATAIGLSSYAQPVDAEHWVTTWSASPSSLPPSLLPADAIADDYHNQTLRLVAHTSIGGDMVRIRISNAHGNKRLNVGAATIALQTEGSGVVAGSIASLTFGGESSVIIARGALVFSDPIPFNVPQLSNLSVSLFLPEASGTVTTHLAAAQTNFVSGPGNFSASVAIPNAEEIPAWNYLTAIDVRTTANVSAIVTLGDSITDGVGSNANLNNRWPNYLARRLLNDDNATDFAVVNAGISGNRVLQENSPRFGENLQLRFERDVLALSGVSHIVLMEGINDIGMGGMFPGEQVSANEIIAGYKQIIARAHARNIKIIGATLTPFEGAAYFTEEGEQKRQNVNAWIRTSGEFDGVIDFELPARDPSHITRLIPSYTADNLHPNDQGYKAMADVIDLNLFQ